MKKITSMILAAAAAVSMTACSSGSPSGSDNSSGGESDTYLVGICQLVQHVALDAALADVKDGKGRGFPRQLQNVHADTYTQERAQGYLYPHNFPGHWVKQQYLPDDIADAKYYAYGENKLEQAAKQYWDTIKSK